VLDLSRGGPTILRPGGVRREEIEAVIGPVEVETSVTPGGMPAPSPGRQVRHYAPRAEAYRYPPGRLFEALAALRRIRPEGAQTGVVCIHDPSWGGYPMALLPAEPRAYAREFYSALRRIDQTLDEMPNPRPWSKGYILIEMPRDLPEWVAVRDRIVRATRPLME
jgi:L-threonylcarbamoyladenylate synthase